MNSINCLREIENKLRSLPSFREDAYSLMEFLLGADKSKILTGFEIEDEKLNCLEKLAERRLNGEPMQKIIGYSQFLNLKISLIFVLKSEPFSGANNTATAHPTIAPPKNADINPIPFIIYKIELFTTINTHLLCFCTFYFVGNLFYEFIQLFVLECNALFLQ